MSHAKEQIILPLAKPDFGNGIHPPKRKSLSKHPKSKRLDRPPVLHLSLTQAGHFLLKPVVKIGDSVKKNQLLASAQTHHSADLHAPYPGKVIDIIDMANTHPSGVKTPTIILETHDADIMTRAPKSQVTLEDLQQGGIIGLGGAGFSTAQKMRFAKEKRATTLILNGAECEPYITCDDRLMQENAADILSGAKILCDLVGTTDVIIAIEENKPKAITAIQTAIEQSNSDAIKLAILPCKYPSGAEKQLITLITGHEIPSGQHPPDLGYLMHNVGTAFAVAKYVETSAPLTERLVTITGELIKKPGNYWVKIGTPVNWLLEQIGVKQDVSRVIHGGAMMGTPLADLEVGVSKITNCLIAPTYEELPIPDDSQNCIRCGFCVDVCPSNLLPQQLFWYAKADDTDNLHAHNLFDCIECGACNYVCPSNLPLVQYYKYAKSKIRLDSRKKTKSDAAKARFEARERRLAAQKAALEKRRREKLARTDKQAIIQAALKKKKDERE